MAESKSPSASANRPADDRIKVLSVHTGLGEEAPGIFIATQLKFDVGDQQQGRQVDRGGTFVNIECLGEAVLT